MQTCGNCLRMSRKSKEPRERERGRTDKTGGDQLPAGNPEIGRLEEDTWVDYTKLRVRDSRCPETSAGFGLCIASSQFHILICIEPSFELKIPP